MTQLQLAAVIDGDEARISRYESGEHEPRMNTLHLLARALGVPLFSLISEPKKKNTK